MSVETCLYGTWTQDNGITYTLYANTEWTRGFFVVHGLFECVAITDRFEHVGWFTEWDDAARWLRERFRDGMTADAPIIAVSPKEAREIFGSWSFKPAPLAETDKR